MSRIAQSAVLAAQGDFSVETAPGYCLRFVRQVVNQSGVMKTLSLNNTLYDFVGEPKWASTAEMDLKRRGWQVSDLKSGDIVFQPYRDPDGNNYGHVAIYIGGNLIIENTTSTRRGKQAPVGGAVRVTPLSEFGRISTIIRIPDAQAGKEKAIVPDVLDTKSNIERSLTQTPYNASLEPPEDAYRAASEKVENTSLETVSKNPDKWFLFNAINAGTGFYDLQGMSTSLGEVSSLVVIRRDEVFRKLENGAPIIAPYIVSVQQGIKRLNQWVSESRQRYGQAGSYTPLYTRLTDWILEADDAILPLPFVTRIRVNEDQVSTGEAEVEFDIPDEQMAYTLLGTLTNIKAFKNAYIDVWLPTQKVDEQKQKRISVVEPMFAGHIDQINVESYPHKISIKLVNPGWTIGNRALTDEDIAGKMTNNWTNVSLAQILYDLGEMVGWKIFGFALDLNLNGLAGIPALQQVVSNYHPAGRDPFTILTEIVSMSGLAYRKIVGVEPFNLGGVTAVYVVYNPIASSVLDEGFWKQALWNFLQPIAKLTGFANQQSGMINIFYPMEMNQIRAQNWATMLSIYGNNKLLKVAMDNLWWMNLISQKTAGVELNIGTANTYMNGAQPEISIAKFWTELFKDDSGGDSLGFVKHTCPVLQIESLQIRSITDQEIQNPMESTPTGGQAQNKTIPASQAARLIPAAKTVRGGVILPTPTGTATLKPGDPVYLYYQKSRSAPTWAIPAVPVQGQEAGHIPQMEFGSNFFPYTVKLSVVPTAGVRPGIPAYIVGFPPLDGEWETHQVEWELSGQSQTMHVTLRTSREIWAAYDRGAVTNP